MRSALAALLLAGLQAAPAQALQGSVDAAKASSYFAEARAVARRDAGALWGRSLEAPMLFVDPATRHVVASAPDAAGRLSREGTVFVGTLTPEVPAANTAVEWAGVRWTMLMWPPPEGAADRARLFAHELFHRLQGELGLPPADRPNAHLDTADGRAWLRLEWRALRAALLSAGEVRRRAVADALAFRARRRSLFPEAAGEERALELNEGLAEYTGVAAALPAGRERTAAAVALIDRSNERPTLVRSFAYVSGPAYGLLLDDRGGSWRRGLTPSSDLGALAAAAYRVTARGEEAGRRASPYGGAALIAGEQGREREREARAAAYRARLVEGRVLRLPLRGGRFSFDPNTVFPLGERGTVYPALRVTDAWGVLTVTGGALIAPDWSAVAVAAAGPPAPEGGALRGDGWSLELAPGWRLAEGTGGYWLEEGP
jgi:hypothetical protein